MASSGHPVCREPDIGQLADRRCRHIGNHFTDGHATGRGRIDRGDRRALAHGHCFTGANIEGGGRHSHISDRNLPGPNHLIPSNQAGNGPVANGDQKALGANRRQTQNAANGIIQIDFGGVENGLRKRSAADTPMHAWRFAEQHFHRQINRLVVEVGIAQFQMMSFCRLAYHCIGAALAAAQGVKLLQVFRSHCHHIPFLGFVTPDFQRRHSRLVTGNVAKLEFTAATAIFDKLRHSVGQTTGAHIMDERDRVPVAHLPAAVDNFLAPTLHLGVVPLH